MYAIMVKLMLLLKPIFILLPENTVFLSYYFCHYYYKTFFIIILFVEKYGFQVFCQEMGTNKWKIAIVFFAMEHRQVS